MAFGSKAEFAEKYLHAGTKINVEGRIQTGNYKDRNGKTVFTAEIVIENQEFAEDKIYSDEFLKALQRFVKLTMPDEGSDIQSWLEEILDTPFKFHTIFKKLEGDFDVFQYDGELKKIMVSIAFQIGE